jgi:hypothetical protein
MITDDDANQTILDKKTMRKMPKEDAALAKMTDADIEANQGNVQ